MLTVVDVPEALEELYRKSRIEASVLAAAAGDDVAPTVILSGSELYSMFPASVLHVRNGMFKCYCRERFIRFYSTGDLIITPPTGNTMQMRLLSEFGADVTVYPMDSFQKRLVNSKDLSALWCGYVQAQDRIMHALCSLYIPEDFTPDFEIRQFNPGDPIIREGEHPEHLFEMLEGRAAVTVNGREIGIVNAEEVFGEISFLTGNARNATVTATQGCMVRLIKGDEFERFAKYRPMLLYKMSKTLAQRLTEVNRRLVSISTMTGS